MIRPWLEPAWREFRQRVASGRLAHGILLCGPAGLGKLQLARDMAAFLLCLQPGETACGHCRSCGLLAGGAHPDRTEIRPAEGKHQIRVDQVRALGAALALTTTISPRKLAVLEPAEAMNMSAANALLKNLEEPPGETVIILVSHDPSRLPVTIRSRCQAISVSLPERDQAADWVTREGGVDGTAAQQALDAGGGSPLRALKLLAEGRVESFIDVRNRLVQMLGRPDRVPASASALAELEPALLWRWLSQDAADAARAGVTGRVPGWLEADPEPALDPVCFARLQQQADRNRALAATTVRQDLLLREWLLEWAGQPLARAG